MKLIILGAGASHDSIFQYFDKVASEPWRPPLCNDLFNLQKVFNPIIEKYPGVKSLRSQILNQTDIEDYFQSQWNFAIGHSDKRLLNCLINIQYYLSEVFCKISEKYSYAGASNIDVLLLKANAYSIAKKEKVVFVTFNYDTLIEDSFHRVIGKKISSMNHYIDSHLMLIKCHGSCNWFQHLNNLTGFDVRNLKSKPIYDFLFDKKFSLAEIESHLDGRIFIYSNDSDFVFRQNKNFQQHYSNYPQLLIPLKDKDGFVLPEAHYQCLTEYLKKVDEILIIGWKGNEAFFNNHLSERLEDKKVKITVVNAKNRDVVKQFNNFNINAQYLFYENMNAKQINPVGSFSQYIQDTDQGKFEDFFN